MSARVEAARDYWRRGWAPIPIPYRQKNPGFSGWQTFTCTEANLPPSFGGVGNIGVRLGADSGGLVDVDLDCPQAVALADTYLPRTGAIFGRRGKPRSHRLYLAPGATFEKFSDPLSQNDCLLELRSDTRAGGREQTVFPPSVHVSGEPIEWWGDAIEPRNIDAWLLRRACAWLAIGCLIARHVKAEGFDPARPYMEMARDLWGSFPEVARPAYRWLGLRNPEEEMRPGLVPSGVALADLVASIPNDLDRENWVRAGLHIFALSGGSAEGREIWRDFSARSARHHNMRTVDRVWGSFERNPPKEANGSFLYWLAQGNVA